ncbi:MAG: CD1375 family protein [Coriobacteriia bacterium]|nr:CD1375 family protein [Coriobacteriia bacterium]
MRIFDEKTGLEIQNPDLTKGCLKNSEQDNIITYKLLQPENIVYDSHVLDNGSVVKTINEEKSTPEKGKWLFADNNGVYKEVEATGFEGWSKEAENKQVEQIQIYHVYTPAEILEHKRLKEKHDKEIERKRKNQELLNELPDFEDDTDNAICDLYELIPEEMKNKNANSKAICKAYARRIIRGEITLEDVPEELREDVRRILEENK